uniref:Sec-independent translocase component C n=1 Tax=Madagascaria erythrocladioides TaxID=753684 RepID=UPI001FCDF56A|nr:Sec-independent translocase component C [Madagascaria erythrocladioides]UNJ16637.1 Sec-independent translocase component C [Madagascaria erythrocladioides]
MKNTSNDSEMTMAEHFEELRQRVLYSIFVFIIITTANFFFIEPIVSFLQLPAHGIQFLQLAPGEYFFSTMKIAFYLGLILSTPFLIYQLIVFAIPGLTISERNIIIPLVVASISLFVIGLSFAYFLLIPAALSFFISYGANLVQPLWSFEQYFDFILVLLLSTGIVFQIPIIQVVLGILKIISSSQMFSIWKYILVLSTVVGAILTPSTDPITQLAMACAVLFLYFVGIVFVVAIEKQKIF